MMAMSIVLVQRTNQYVHERHRYQFCSVSNYSFEYFYCMNQSSHSCISSEHLCDGHADCEHGDDEQFCTTNRTVVEEMIFVYHII